MRCVKAPQLTCSPRAATASTIAGDQGSVTCRRSTQAPWFNVGRLSTRHLTQCMACGVVRCPAGHYCAAGEEPAICPSGYYCPGGSVKFICPAGHYCPQRSSKPLGCRGIAHCPEGAFRENLWTPLFLCLAVLVALYYARAAAKAWMTGKLSVDGILAAVAGRKLEQLRPKEGSEPPAVVVTPRFSPSAATSEPLVPRISMSFQGLRLVTRGNVRMDGVSGSIRAGRITAIMGGSGAGKTTLSNLLLGKETPTAGSVAVTVTPPPTAADAFQPFTSAVSCIRNTVGFVPQVDCMPRELTVRQVVEHSAFTRLPGSWSGEVKAAHIDRVLQSMGLTHVAHSVIGSESTPGISGGEIKRTNIAIELAANPALLFLDEPTTGLDATAAFRALELLQRTVRREGITVAAVIHQPREEILGEFNAPHGTQVSHSLSTVIILSHHPSLPNALPSPCRPGGRPHPAGPRGPASVHGAHGARAGLLLPGAGLRLPRRLQSQRFHDGCLGSAIRSQGRGRCASTGRRCCNYRRREERERRGCGLERGAHCSVFR